MTQKKKLIEVALPLEAINVAAAREKSIRHGHPSTLHLWWARRPLAACRAVLFASLVDDPSSRPEEFPTVEAQDAERQRLFRLIEEMVKWENSNNERVLLAAKAEILKCTDGNPPPVLDPFCGGGSIPLEAQRLGLEAHGSDLNPVAVMITKALIEIPPKFAGRPPVHPNQDEDLVERSWKGAQGLAEDVRYYGRWMREDAEKRIGHLYPKVKLPKEQGGGEATVIAWLWARTVKCPNPACGATMPLVRSFWLSSKKGKQAWVEPVIDMETKSVRFEVRTGDGEAPLGTVKNRAVRCVVCESTVGLKYVRDEAQGGRMGSMPLAIVAEGHKGRVYVAPDPEQERVAAAAKPKWKPEQKVPTPCHDVDRLPMYGMYTWGDAFTPRQLVALTTFSDLVGEAREKVLKDAVKAGLKSDKKPLDEGGSGAQAYADAVATYLAFGVDRGADYWSAICSWHNARNLIGHTFVRQAISMIWDFAEGNPFSESTGNFQGAVDWITKVVEMLPAQAKGQVRQMDSSTAIPKNVSFCISTDPPYYDNIGYADLSDFFYVWLRKALGDIYPEIFSTLLVPKSQELIATPYRFEGSKERAKVFFEEGLGRAFRLMNDAHDRRFPMTIYYAFKQAEEDEDKDDRRQGQAHGSRVASTGWETMLEGLLKSGFCITGTWPMRSELANRSVARNTNSLASSIVLVCRPRPESAPLANRKEFIAALRRELPLAIRNMQHGNVAPVDMAQASIGPGMAIFSRYAKVYEADGSVMSVRTALQMINEELDTYLKEQEGELDIDSRFCVAWFEQYGTKEGAFGQAEVLAKAKNTSPQGLVTAGVAQSKAGKLRLLGRAEFSDDWDPMGDKRLTVWECTQHLIKALDREGEIGAARLAAKLGGGRSEDARALAYRLYSICERKGWSEEGVAYNNLVTSWSGIQDQIARLPSHGVQEGLF